jgi:4-alpha-glucanotransferase
MSSNPSQPVIQPSYPGPDGSQIAVPEATIRHFERLLGEGAASDIQRSTAPQAACHFPEWLRDTRVWGIALQLYELRSGRNWGIGDFDDLARFCEVASAAGADFVGLNPLHAPFLADSDRCSPFSPSNRRFLNPLYIAVDKVTGFRPELVAAADIEGLRAGALVDYVGVARTKLAALRAIFAERQEIEPGFEAFCQNGGEALWRHAVFETLSEKMTDAGMGAGWQGWPIGLQDVAGEEVRRFAAENADVVRFHLWLQWLARSQLDAARKRALDAGMRIGLYLDLAVGEAPDGSASWSAPDLTVAGVKIGAPPDVFSAGGQDWGLAPLSPVRLAQDDWKAYCDLMGSAMEGAGALRIDHAMSLRQLFWIPQGATPADGGFVTYPMEGMIRVLADLSARSGVIVIGEDLGHVPNGFRDAMTAANIFSYRILYFERRDGRFIRPRDWPLHALACLSTHDLPTLKGWWKAHDIALRAEHELIGPEAAIEHRAERTRERRSLLAGLKAAGLASPGLVEKDVRFAEQLAVAAHRFIARTPSRLCVMRLADAVGEDQPTNLPGVADGFPNWRRKLDVPLEQLSAHPLFRAVTGALAKERPR